MDEKSSPRQPNASPAFPGNKRTILLSAAALATGLAIFLIAFLPDDDPGKKGRGAREGRTGNSSATERGDKDGGFSPVGGRDRKPARDQGDAWWYRDNASAGKDPEGDAWWYREKPRRERADDSKKPPRKDAGTAAEGGRKTGKSAKGAESDAGPDLYWWRD